ncbi:MAG: queuosine precursor transporter [Patescibacteria group bacterium]
MKNYKYYPMITGLFAACLVISNILDTKIFKFFSLDLPGGIILFPIVYVFADILTEVYGYAYSRRVIWTGFGALLLMIIALTIVQQLPAASFWTLQKEYDDILGKVPRIVAASISAYFLGEFANSFTLAKLKLQSEGKRMPLRFVLSTIVGQFVDTTIFVLIAFSGEMAVNDLMMITLSAWAFKVGWEIIALPITLPLVKKLKRIENEDYYDRETNFSPFKLS